MRATLDRITEYLSGQLDGVRVKTAYDRRILDRPVISPSVYMTINDSNFGGVLNFIAYVYSPIVKGGIGCIELAEETAYQLQLCEEFTVCGLTVGKVSFNSSSNAFVIQINCSIFGEGDEGVFGGAFSVSAFNFSYDSELQISFKVPNISFESNFSPYPIMTIGDSVPVDVICTGSVHKITLQNLSRKTTKKLCSNGSFDMRIKHGAKTEEYFRCLASGGSFSTENLQKGFTVTVISYDTKGEG